MPGKKSSEEHQNNSRLGALAESLVQTFLLDYCDFCFPCQEKHPADLICELGPAMYTVQGKGRSRTPEGKYVFATENSRGQSEVYKNYNCSIIAFVFFPEKKVIKFNDQPDIELTEKEVGILKCLLSHGEEPVDRKKLLKQVWNYNPGVTTHTLETHIYRLRQKLEISPSAPRIIVSEGGGFKLNPV